VWPAPNTCCSGRSGSERDLRASPRSCIGFCYERIRASTAVGTRSMEQLFRDRLREVRAVGDLVALWRQTLTDWAVSVPARYRERGGSHSHFSPLADPARRCLFFARSEASSFSRREITVEHLLLGVLREEPSLVPRAALDAVMRTIEASEPAGATRPTGQRFTAQRGGHSGDRGCERDRAHGGAEDRAGRSRERHPARNEYIGGASLARAHFRSTLNAPLLN